MNIRWLVVATVLSAGGATGALTQKPAVPAGAMQLDVVVTDANTRPIRDLRPADFELTDAGEPRVIDSVRLHAGGSRLVAIFLDEYHVQAGDSTRRAQKALAQFVDTELRADDLVAIMKPLDPLNAIQLTQDRNVIRQAIANFNGRRGDYVPRTAFEENFMSRAPAAADAARAQVVTAALQALTQRLGDARDGRKAVVLVSEGFTPALPRGSDRLMGGVRAIVYAANRYGVTIYPISPRLGAADDDDENSSRLMLALRTLAEHTGGEASINQADLTPALKQVAADLDGYYVVTYRAPGAGDGRFHPVQLRLKRPDARVRTRSGYWAADAALLRPASGITARALTTPRRPPHSSPYIRPWIGMARGPDGLTSVTVTWEPATAPPRNQRVASITLKATTDDGRVLFQDRIGAAEADDTGAVTKLAERAMFNAPPGQIALEMAVQNSSGVPLDTDIRAMPVPDLRVTRPTFATPQLLPTRSARAFARVSANPDAVPVAARNFSRAERLLIRIPVYGASDTIPDVTATLLNRRGTPMRLLEQMAVALPPGIVQFDLPLSSLAPDEYRVELVAANSRGPREEARELVIFQVTH